ncbi:hypothetical protein N7523_000236 [Penicillium sp. IBT 18751x]|nr:hypothetical protein N7523_000236 [Penicillium sp. IBT 18751x]
MAHQAHNIPWTILASNLRWARVSSGQHDAYDLHPCFKPDQAKNLTYFAKAFAGNVREHSKCERKKYSHYKAPSATDMIIDDNTAAKIHCTICRWREACEEAGRLMFCGLNGRSCRSQKLSCCTCGVLPHEQRIASAFCRGFQSSPCIGFLPEQSAGYFNMEIVKTLVIHGYMEPILRACAYPNVAIGAWWNIDVCGCFSYELGWDQIYKKALMVYICLNTIFCFPELWDHASVRTEQQDYRHTRLYQRMVIKATEPGDISHVVAYPHRQFFGINDPSQASSFTESREWQLLWGHYTDEYGSFKNVYGKLSYDNLLEMRKLDACGAALPDTEQVLSILGSRGLPVELALDIMELADYSPKRKLNVAHDPFHPDNRKQLAQYLNYCWQLLVRCDMMANELGLNIDWEDTVTDCMGQLWEAPEMGRKRLTKDSDDYRRVIFR